MNRGWDEAARRRDEGIARSAESSGDEWASEALSFLRRFLERHPTMFVDELWDGGLPEPKSPRALGAVIQRAARMGWIAEIRTARGITARPSVRSNGQLKRVWRSELHRVEGQPW